MESDSSYQSRGGITYGHKGAFWAGIWAVTIGVILHLPMYLKAHDVGYRLVGTPMDMPMKIGMVLIVLGLILTLYGLLPKKDLIDPDILNLKVRALDDAPIRGQHVALLHGCSRSTKPTM